MPTPERVTVVDLFATWCAPCDEQVDILDSVRGEYDGVSFVSVTNERPSESLTRADIADWWAENDGAWTVGIDPGSELMAAFGADGLPYVAIVDAEGRCSSNTGDSSTPTRSGPNWTP
ncbi:thioredoxin [Halolamina pelagica]|uniref:Thioredoxin n=1 Tax=Halolamina pelagica TaxID=699431 RepID=A0A0P7GDG8_9EURY|nr:TlpA disulfide reductase family protein [Halolamina pelagica]KPN32183.1 thioredoxin [Halolamina pelagica]